MNIPLFVLAYLAIGFLGTFLLPWPSLERGWGRGFLAVAWGPFVVLIVFYFLEGYIRGRWGDGGE